VTRFRIIVEYDGTGLVGWQRQDNGVSVQSALEKAIFDLTQEVSTVTGAGRTDAGVHAMAQSAHFDLSKDFPPDKIRDGLNHFLRPAAIAVIGAEAVAPKFHARFSAVRRHYFYRILCRRAPPALDRNRVWHVVRDLDAEAMHAGAQHLVGQHDFTTFRSSECQAKSPVKTLDRLEVRRAGDEVHIEASARSFLHNQVRSMVGSLKMVGEGKWVPRDMAKALEAKDRSACGVVAPAEGLYLVGVDYT
jgi:tRNA pseudouridine38-40 synthase